MKLNKLSTFAVATLLTACEMNAQTAEIYGVKGQDIYKGYSIGNSEIHKKLKAAGYEATVQEVQDIIDGKTARWAVVDIRTKDEYLGAFVPGVKRTGREAPELSIQEMFLQIEDVEKDGKKTKVYKGSDIDGIVLMCRTGTRAAYDWISHSFAGFGKNVKIFSTVEWANACKPLKNGNGGNIETAMLEEKKVKLAKAKDGFYYKEGCSQLAK